ncbi:DNA-binding protein [Suicoccus acidiformans]|uniref:DNA-binding protein n=1 Tax=Suicoccus acidiformans TaxID=2036206 RepID=A0A347WK66_9LACT|nr:YlxR family protein [Suicoccus acidiformans]AXY25473.1 DNA-binding protein [Suicoccus acidiformans]
MSKQGRQRKIPMRKCIVSQEMYPKKELVRVVKTKENEVFLDPTGRQNGRGAYIALDPELAKKAKKERTFDKAFGIKIADEFYDELYAYVDHQKARQELL